MKQVLVEIKDTVVEKREKLLSYGWKVLIVVYYSQFSSNLLELM